MNNYFLSFKLTNFYGSRVETLEDEDGNKEECVVIPLKRNGLKVSDANGAVYVNAFVNEKVQTHDKHTHYITQYCVRDHLSYLRELGYPAPRLGYMDKSVYKPSFQDEVEFKRSQSTNGARVKMDF